MYIGLSSEKLSTDEVICSGNFPDEIDVQVTL